MSLPSQLPILEPAAPLLAWLSHSERIPRAVRRQADFYQFFATTIFPLLEAYQERLSFRTALRKISIPEVTQMNPSGH
jgi:hypothetical protein